MGEFLLDKIDKKILSILEFNARDRYNSIAKQIGISREVVQYRISNLEKRGIISSYYTVIDYSKLGLLFCRVFATLSLKLPESFFQFVEKQKNVSWVTLGEGKYNLSIVILGKNIQEIHDLIERMTEQFNDVLDNIYVSFASKIYHFAHNYLYSSNNKNQIVIGNNEKKVMLDTLDLSLLSLLSQDARVSSVELANKLDTSAKVVAYRIKKLLRENIILGWRMKINSAVLGYDHYKVYVSMKNMSALEKESIFSYLRSHDNVIYITEVLGKYSFEFEIEVKNMNELHLFFDKFKEMTKGKLKKYDITHYYDEKKISYISQI